MALAYAVVLVTNDLYKHHQRDVVAKAQEQADERFKRLAEEALLGTVTRNPEPRVMTHAELRNAFPGNVHLDNLTGLYFTANIA